MVLPLIAAGIGAAASAFGTIAQNAESKRASEAQMAFQERMSNTQYARAMQDMRKSGLNPILAYKQGGAGTPGGSTYSPANVGTAAVQGATQSTSSALAARRQDVELDLLAADTDLRREQLSTQKAIQTREMAQAGLAGAQSAQSVATTRILGEQLQSASAAASSAKHDQEIMETPVIGPGLRWIDVIGRSLNPFASTAKDASDIGK